jgi:hypothetical protein
MIHASKYRNRRVGGKHSKKEFNVGEDLKLQQRLNIQHPQLGAIVDITEQHRIRIEVNGVHICFYVCDYVITYQKGCRYLDVKPTFKSEESRKAYRTTNAYQMFNLKRKLVEAIYNIKIEEV